MKENYDKYFADWMTGQISDTELKKLIPKDEYLRFLKIKKGINVLSEIKNNEKSWNDVRQKIKKRNSGLVFRVLKFSVPVAAVLLIFFAIRLFGNNTEVVITTKKGEFTSVELPDHSKVFLNAASQLRYNKKNWHKKRELYLKGEAFFKVQKGQKFTVHTGQGDISVLGTQFDVKQRDKYLKVVCYEGKVSVKISTEDFILPKGTGIVKNHSRIDKLNITTGQPSWLDGISKFSAVPLYLVMEEMQNQYDISFQVDKSVDTMRKFTGGFVHHNLDLALRNVFKTMNISYQKKGNIIVLKKE